MKVTFLVGNGFDISVGLNTGYSSFYEWYCNLPKDENDTSYLQEFKNSIRNYIERVHAKTDLEDETWADFELGLGEYTERYTEDTGNHFLECREDAFEKMIDYLWLQQEKFDIKKFSDDDIKRIRMDVGAFHTVLLPTEEQAIQQIFDSVVNQNSTLHFISFNYTNALDKVVEKISESPISVWEYASSKHFYRIDPTVLHIHGKLDEYPILAVHDESQIKNKDLLSTVGFREAMIKSAGIQAMGREWYSKAQNLIENSKIICIWGMSLGATDRKWWEKIAVWLSKHDSRHLVIFQHMDTPLNNRSIVQYVTNKNKVIDKFFSYTSMTEERKEVLKKRIHVAFNVNGVLQLESELKVPELV